MIKTFIKKIDEEWEIKKPHIIPFKIIGSSALFLQYNYSRITKDTDVIEVAEFTPEIKKQLLNIAGKESKLCKSLHLYIDIVAKAFPLLPTRPNFHTDHALNKELRHFHVEILDATDVIVSKICRFSSTDVDDIKAMVDLDAIDPQKLEERFLCAIEQWKYEARAEKLPKIISNFHTIQRDMLDVEESIIELPDWI